MGKEKEKNKIVYGIGLNRERLGKWVFVYRFRNVKVFIDK